MPDLNGTKTHENLKEAFAGESQANRKYLAFALQTTVLWASVWVGRGCCSHSNLDGRNCGGWQAV